jgi:RNA polymerase sigma-70 factor, ECF subfamily
MSSRATPTPIPLFARPAVAYDAHTLASGLTLLLPDLLGRAMRLAANRALADDLVQDTVERTLRFSSQYEPGTNLRAWVFRILFSVFVTKYRQRRREKRALDALASDPCAWTRPESFPMPSAAMRLTATTEKVVNTLPPGFRTVVLLVDVGQRSYREAASELGLPVGTIMSRLHRGRRMLAARLEEAPTVTRAA